MGMVAVLTKIPLNVVNVLDDLKEVTGLNRSTLIRMAIMDKLAKDYPMQAAKLKQGGTNG